MELQEVYRQIAECRACGLCRGRTNPVPGEGCTEHPLVMCIGEGPGEQEDLSGRPFVGPAGQLLDKMLACIGLDRTNTYIANVVKCRPPMNRQPEWEEMQACLPHLRAQVRILRPRILFCLGATAGKAIIDPNFRVTRQRGQWIERKGFYMMATYHPSALLRDKSGQYKREAYEDLKKLKAKIDELTQQEMSTE